MINATKKTTHITGIKFYSIKGKTNVRPINVNNSNQLKDNLSGKKIDQHFFFIVSVPHRHECDLEEQSNNFCISCVNNSTVNKNMKKMTDSEEEKKEKRRYQKRVNDMKRKELQHE